MSRAENQVDGLLGPEEPEVGCDDCFAALDRYVELELAGELQLDVVVELGEAGVAANLRLFGAE